METPLLSVCLITYNHANYIRQAIEGILMQKVNFSWELIIADDFSTDGTKEIVLDYKKKYPEFIKLILQEKNVGAAQNWIKLMNSPKSKYIAYFEGDDYWTDPYKLQKQVNFLEDNENCNYVFTKNLVLRKDGSFYTKFKDEFTLPALFDLNYLLKINIMPATQSVVFRKSMLPQEFPAFLNKTSNGDWALLFLIAHKGTIGFINEYTCVYREGVGVISNTNNIYKFKNGLELNKQLNKYTLYKFDYHIGNYDFHYENITYSYFENKHRIQGLYYFLLKIIYSFYKNKILDFHKNNFVFIKHSIKLLFKSFLK